MIGKVHVTSVRRALLCLQMSQPGLAPHPLPHPPVPSVNLSAAVHWLARLQCIQLANMQGRTLHDIDVQYVCNVQRGAAVCPT
jgi:hypothetical protein